MPSEFPQQTWRSPIGSGTSHVFAIHLAGEPGPPAEHDWKAVCGYDLHKLTGPRAGATWSGPLRTPGELTTPHKGRERSKCPKCVAVVERFRAGWAETSHLFAGLFSERPEPAPPAGDPNPDEVP